MSSFHPLRDAKRWWRRGRLKRNGISEELTLDKVSVGTGSGAWVCTLQDLDESSIVYSFGAGTDISFDTEIQARTGAVIHVFDPTPRSIEWVRSQSLPDNVAFHDYGIGSKDGTIEFYPPRRAQSSHFTPIKRYKTREFGEPIEAPVYRLGSISQKLGHSHVDLLKLDIEGGEFDVIDDLLTDRPLVKQLLIEFHHNYQTVALSKTLDAVARIRAAGFGCYHISERTYEMSFIRT